MLGQKDADCVESQKIEVLSDGWLKESITAKGQAVVTKCFSRHSWPVGPFSVTAPYLTTSLSE